MKLRRLLGVFAIFWLTAAISQLQGQDKVEYFDKKANKVATYSGDIKEDTVSGVKISVAKKEIPVDASDITRVSYQDLPAVLKLEYGATLTAEDKKEYAKALSAYKDVLTKVPAGLKSRRQIEYRVAMLSAQLADTVENGNTIATDLLAKYIKDNPTGWQFSSAGKTLARMQLAADKFDDALVTLEAMEKAPNMPKEIKQEVELMTIDLLIRSDKVDQAAARITNAMASLQANDPQRQRLSIYQIGADKAMKGPEKIVKLEGLINGTNDEVLRALGYNTLGDTYQAEKRQRDAMWAYLWVDVVYNKEKSEHMKAMDRLAKLFDAMNDPDRAKQYKDKLARMK